MSDICVLCLSKDRQLFIITDSFWHLISSTLNWDAGEFQYIKCMQAGGHPSVCWECRARLASFSAFIKRGQESIKIFKEYLKTQVLEPSSKSKLRKSEILVLNLTTAVEENDKNIVLVKHVDHDAKTADDGIKLEIEPAELVKASAALHENASSSTVKTENSVVDDSNYIDIDMFMEPSYDTDDDKSALPPAIAVNALESAPQPITTKRKLRSKTKADDKSKVKTKKGADNIAYYTMSWVSNEQAQQWYLEERDKERSLNPTCAHACEACDRNFPEESILKKHFEEHHNETLGPYLCFLCLYRFAKEKEKNQHVETHFLLYKCKQCSYECRTLTGIQEHSEADHGVKIRTRSKTVPDVDKLYKCSRCKTIFATMMLLKKHRAHCSLYKCEQCEKTFKYNPSYYEHLKSHRSVAGDDLMYCQVCDTYFKSAKWYKQHFLKSLKHVSRDAFKHECDHCGMKFSIPRRLQEHIGSVHLKTGIYQCEHCPKAYMTKGMLIRHRASLHNVGTVSKSKDKICDVCGKAFTSNHLLNNHMRSHTGEKPFKCEYCPSSFAQNGTLYTHSKVVHKKRISKAGHADTDRYRCEVCNKDFGTDAKRRVHYEYYHLKNAKYSCEVCNKNFISSTNLKNHNASRHGLISTRNYSCQTCGKTFNSASAKCQHMKTHSSERKLKCRSCDAAFRNTGALYMHYKMKHLKLKRGDRVSIKNLCKTDSEIIVSRDP